MQTSGHLRVSKKCEFSPTSLTLVNVGCPSHNCLRSHINMTETLNSLVMITKAGVTTNKITVGVSSCGRSFKMTVANCTGPMCTFVGKESAAATKGVGTETAGYIANAEMQEIIEEDDMITTWHEDDTETDYLDYDGMPICLFLAHKLILTNHKQRH